MHDAWVAEQQRNLQFFEANKMQSQWAAEFDVSSKLHNHTQSPPVQMPVTLERTFQIIPQNTYSQSFSSPSNALSLPSE